MAHDEKILRQSMEQFEEDRQRRREAFARHREQIFREIPRLEEIDRELKGAMSKIIASSLKRGTDPLPALRVIRDKNLDLQRERSALLMEHGYEADELEEKPDCVLCGDTGFRDGVMCRCLQKYYARAQIRDLSRMLDMGTASFETFDFDWYSDREDPDMGVSPRAIMEKNYDTCQDYAHQFGAGSGNLLLWGDPGLGKTFLSACIARVVSERGFSVVYDTATHVFAQFEAAKFSRDDETAREDADRCMNCDLLILDDVGTEMVTTFVQSALYQIVNGRLLAGRATLISTNLDPAGIGRRYSPQILSRLEGEYQILPFFGEDIRRLKRERE